MPKSLLSHLLLSLIASLFVFPSLQATDVYRTWLTFPAIDKRSSNRFSSDKSEFLKKFRGATSNVDTMANDYVDAEANVGNVDFAGVHNGEWIGTSEQPPENEATRQTGTSMLRERRQFQQSLAASASSSMSAARYYASCEEFCVAHVRQCVRLCLGFSTPLRGLCRTHCKARQRACPRECAGDR